VQYAHVEIDNNAVGMWHFQPHISTNWHWVACPYHWSMMETNCGMNVYKLRALVSHSMLVTNSTSVKLFFKIPMQKCIEWVKNSLHCEILIPVR